MSRTYFEVSVFGDFSNEQFLEKVLSMAQSCSCDGVLEKNLDVDLNPDHWEILEEQVARNTPLLEFILVYFSNLKNHQSFLQKLEKHKILYQVEEKNGDEDWGEAWKKSYQPVTVSSTILVGPPWESEKMNAQPHMTSILIDPAMAFGTGTHETTQISLCLMEEVIKIFSIHSVLDFGCGSGILGIYALLKGIKRCDFFDIDENCHTNTRINLELNHCNQSHSILYIEEIPKNAKYDLVVANIISSVLLKEKVEILSHVKGDGFLILSGVLAESNEKFIGEFLTPKIDLLRVEQKNEWVGYLFKGKES